MARREKEKLGDVIGIVSGMSEEKDGLTKTEEILLHGMNRLLRESSKFDSGCAVALAQMADVFVKIYRSKKGII